MIPKSRCDNVLKSYQRYNEKAILLPVIRQITVLQHKPPIPVALDIIRPLEQWTIKYAGNFINLRHFYKTTEFRLFFVIFIYK